MSCVLDQATNQKFIQVAAAVIRKELQLSDDLSETEVLKEGFKQQNHASFLAYPIMYAIGYQDLAEDHCVAYAILDDVRLFFKKIMKQESTEQETNELSDHLDICHYLMIGLLYSEGSLSKHFTKTERYDIADALSMQIRNPVVDDAIDLDAKTIQPDLHAEYVDSLEEYLATLI